MLPKSSLLFLKSNGCHNAVAETFLAQKTTNLMSYLFLGSEEGRLIPNLDQFSNKLGVEAAGGNN